MPNRIAAVLALTALLLLAARSGFAEEPSVAERTALDERLDTLGTALESTDPARRVAAVRRLLTEASATEAFPRLLAIAKAHEGAGHGRAALEGLGRLAAPRMTSVLDRGSGGGGGRERTGADLLRSQARHPVRILPSVEKRLEALVPGSGRVGFEDPFMRLAAITQQLEIAFVLDAATREVAVMTPTEAVVYHEEWFHGPGPDALAWADFLREQEGAVHDGLGDGEIDVAIAQLLGEDPTARRRAAYVLGRSTAAGPSLRRTLEAVGPAQREVIEPVLARHELRALGDVVFISHRSGSPQLYRMRMDGGLIERLTSETRNVFLPEPSPNGRHIAYRHDHGDRQSRFAVLDLEDRTTWRPPAGASAVRAWSPDGRYLAYVNDAGRARSMRLLDTTTGKDRELGEVHAPRQLGHPAPPTWSPNGHGMVYATEDQLLSQALPDGELRVLARGAYRSPQYLDEDVLVVRHEAGRDSLVRLGPDGSIITYPRPEEEFLQQVTISPNGRRAVVATIRGDRRNRKSPGIYLLDLAADASIRRLGEGLYPRLRWSPTGNVLAIDLSYNTISLLDEDGEALGEPRGGIHAGDVIWGERGEAFHAAGLLPLEQPVSMDRLRVRSQLVRWQTGAWKVLRQVEGYLGVRRVTPDGRWLILASEETGDREFVAASTDGRFWLSLTDHPADDESAMPVPLPTGR